MRERVRVLEHFQMLGGEKSGELTLKIRMLEVWEQKLSRAPFFGWQVVA